jgi:hypothetical protein
MLAPAAMFIESAVDMIKQKDQKQVAAELKELRFASPQLQQLRDSLPPDTTDVEIGYQIGLTVARILLMEHPGIGLARKIQDIKQGPEWFNQVAEAVTEEFQAAL